MGKNIVIAVLLVAVVGIGYLYWKDHQALVAYQQQQQARDALAQAARTKTEAIFDRLDGSILHFRTPVSTVTSAGTFVNYREYVATVTANTALYQVGTSLQIKDIPSGSTIYLTTSPDPSRSGQAVIDAIYLIQ